MSAQTSFTSPGSESQALAIPGRQSPEIIDAEYRIVPDHACQHDWNWIALYEDGEMLTECQGSDEHLAFASIDIPRTTAMVIVPNRDGLPVISVKRTGADWRPIFFRRHQTELAVEEMRIVGNRTIHCLGYQRTLNVEAHERNVATFTFAFEDGSLLTSDDRNAV